MNAQKGGQRSQDIHTQPCIDTNTQHTVYPHTHTHTHCPTKGGTARMRLRALNISPL